MIIQNVAQLMSLVVVQQPWSSWWLGEEAQVVFQIVAQLRSLVVVQQPWSSWWLCQESGGTSDK